jgi:hypothetical protein
MVTVGTTWDYFPTEDYRIVGESFAIHFQSRDISKTVQNRSVVLVSCDFFVCPVEMRRKFEGIRLYELIHKMFGQR